MPTTVHIPPEILQTIDAQARKKKMSRNKYIVEALVARVAAERAEARWPPSLFEEMARWRNDPGHVEAVDELRRTIVDARRSKKPISL